MKLKLSLEDCDKLSKPYGWARIDWQENIAMASYKKDKIRINVYLTKMTVSTAMKHPKKGKTQLFRRDLTPDGLREIFENPRKHTGKGYYKAT